MNEYSIPRWIGPISINYRSRTRCVWLRLCLSRIYVVELVVQIFLAIQF